jgi:hypothetical protein
VCWTSIYGLLQVLATKWKERLCSWCASRKTTNACFSVLGNLKYLANTSLRYDFLSYQFQNKRSVEPWSQGTPDPPKLMSLLVQVFRMAHLFPTLRVTIAVPVMESLDQATGSGPWRSTYLKLPWPRQESSSIAETTWTTPMFALTSTSRERKFEVASPVVVRIREALLILNVI